MRLTDLQINSRNELFEQLELMSSKTEQLDYQTKVPIAYVSSELFWGWDSAFQNPRKQSWFKGIYTSQELNILSALDDKVEEIRSSLPSDIPHLEEFLETPQWMDLSKAAGNTLSKLKQLQY